MISNDIPTMLCVAQNDDREEWSPIASAFNTAFDDFISESTTNQENGAKTWGQSEKDLIAAGLAVARFISDNPGVLREKRAMATCLRDWSLELNENWCEGLADLIDASNRELPTRLRANGDGRYPTPQKIPSWPPAREFWERVKQLEITMGEAALTVLKAVPMTEEELCNKVLIAAFTGGLALVVRTISVGPPVVPGAGVAETWLRRLMTVTDLSCLAAIMDPRSFDEIVGTARTYPFHYEPSPSELVRLMLGVADDCWIRGIWSDAKRLGLVGARHGGAPKRIKRQSAPRILRRGTDR